MTYLQTLVVILDAVLLTLVIGGTAILIHKLKLGDKNHVLIFILFILYWMAPLMCREYTGQMHIHMGIGDGGWLLWLPLTIYGIAGLFWRPLTDFLTYKLQSRKAVIYISLGIQLITLWPMFIWQNLATNIIQSIGTGVGASAIGLFNLMFSEDQRKKKVFVTVSILAIPPLLSEFITSCVEAMVCSMVPEHGEQGTAPASVYLDFLKWLWLVAIIFIIASFIITKFIKEERESLFHDLGEKEPIVSKHNWRVVILVLVVGGLFGFIRWVSAGPSSVTQLIYIAMFDKMNPETQTSYFLEEVKFFEGYLSLMFALGQLVGTIIAGFSLSKHAHKSQIPLIGIGAFTWLVYLLTNGLVINVHMYFWSNILNGAAFGLIFPVLVGIMLNKVFVHRRIITPVGMLNTVVAAGVTGGALFNNLIKGNVYDFHFTPETSTAPMFKFDNWLVNGITMIIVVCMFILFVSAFLLERKNPPMKANFNAKFMGSSHGEI